MHTYMENWFFSKLQREFSGEIVIFSLNGTGTIAYQYTKKTQKF